MDNVNRFWIICINRSSSSSDFFPLFVNSITGNVEAKANSTLKFNPSTNTLTTTTFSGALSGNATTASALQTAVNIGGVSFDGSSNIDLPGVNTTGDQDAKW